MDAGYDAMASIEVECREKLEFAQESNMFDNFISLVVSAFGCYATHER